MIVKILKIDNYILLQYNIDLVNELLGEILLYGKIVRITKLIEKALLFCICVINIVIVYTL